MIDWASVAVPCVTRAKDATRRKTLIQQTGLCAGGSGTVERVNPVAKKVCIDPCKFTSPTPRRSTPPLTPMRDTRDQLGGYYGGGLEEATSQ